MIILAIALTILFTVIGAIRRKASHALWMRKHDSDPITFKVNYPNPVTQPHKAIEFINNEWMSDCLQHYRSLCHNMISVPAEVYKAMHERIDYLNKLGL